MGKKRRTARKRSPDPKVVILKPDPAFDRDFADRRAGWIVLSVLLLAAFVHHTWNGYTLPPIIG